MPRRFFTALFLLSAALASAFAAEDEWEPYRKTGLFPEGGRWVAPDMRKESVDEFAARLLNGAQDGDAKSMASLGRLFYLRGDAGRAAEWLGKAAEGGHTGAQLDLGVLKSKGEGIDLAEAYQWLWLAMWAKEPGADAALQQLTERPSPKLESWQVLLGVQRAAAFQSAHPAPAAKAASAGTK
jgi:TPR repeat protein